jgi:hypothetical protein
MSGDAGAELVDDAHRLVADDEPGTDRILALDDVDVGPADGRRGDPHDGLPDAGVRAGYRLDADVVGSVEHRRPHGV